MEKEAVRLNERFRQEFVDIVRHRARTTRMLHRKFSAWHAETFLIYDLFKRYKGLEMNAIHLSKFNKKKKKTVTFASDASNDFINANSTITLQSRATLTAWQTIATVKWSRDATAARKNAINCRKASSNSRDETLSRWIMLKRLKSGINKQSAEGGAKGTERRRQYRRTRSSNSEDRA